jgi:hypothetical protein
MANPAVPAGDKPGPPGPARKTSNHKGIIKKASSPMTEGLLDTLHSMKVLSLANRICCASIVTVAAAHQRSGKASSRSQTAPALFDNALKHELPAPVPAPG